MGKFSSMGLVIDQPVRMLVLHPKTAAPLQNASGEDCYIDLLALDSDAGRAYEREIADEQLNRRGNPQSRIDVLEEIECERLARLTKAWRLAGWDGSPVAAECTRENARELYADQAMRWLRDQVTVFLNNRANFLPPSSKVSSPSQGINSGSTGQTTKARPSANT